MTVFLLVPSTKSQTDFSFIFWMIEENKLCGKHKFMMPALFRKMTFTNEDRFYDFLSINAIAISKKIMLGYKRTTLRSHDFNVTTCSG